MTIPSDVIERIKISNDIVSVVSGYVPDLKRAGRNWKACCPFHNDKTPSFVVSPEKEIFSCFSCHVSGDVFKFVMLSENISWIEAVKKLARNANIEIQKDNHNAIKPSEKQKIYSLLERAAAFYHKNLLCNPDAAHARQYLSKRGVNDLSIEKFFLGYAPKGSLLSVAAKQGFSAEDLIKAGLIAPATGGSLFEYMSERIVFPIFDVRGQVIAFGGRVLTDERKPKYLNTPETAVYSKSYHLYGLFQTLPELRKERKAILLEGYMDVVIPQQCGVVGAVASLGTSLTNEQAKLIARHADSVKLLYDADDAGRKATRRALEILAEEAIESNVPALPAGVDADEFLCSYGKEAFSTLLAESKSSINWIIESIDEESVNLSPEKKAKLIAEYFSFVMKSPNEIIQNEYIKKISTRFIVNSDVVWREFKRQKYLQHRKKYYEKKK
ncbi:MAG: DNA primase [Endomicrobium sp.]|jgi:DNA primase|nr:DNA primase [Endomicrobium sp.]